MRVREHVESAGVSGDRGHAASSVRHLPDSAEKEIAIQLLTEL